VATISEDGGQSYDYVIHADLISTLLDISQSAVPVRTLRIEYFLPTLSRLTAIVNHLPDLHRLDLELISASSQFNLVSNTLTCVLSGFINTHFTISQEDMTTPSDPSFETYFDCDGNPLDPLDTIEVY
jgi:hypothetical protein